MTDPVERLRGEFAERRSHAQKDAARADARLLRNATLGGGLIGLVAVVLTATVTRRALFWHSFLLEAALGAVAGRLMARVRGGPFEGVLLFGGAALLAWSLRALGLDPSVLFARGDLRAAAAIQGNVTSLCFAVAGGAALGHLVRS